MDLYVLRDSWLVIVSIFIVCAIRLIKIFYLASSLLDHNIFAHMLVRATSCRNEYYYQDIYSQYCNSIAIIVRVVVLL